MARQDMKLVEKRLVGLLGPKKNWRRLFADEAFLLPTLVVSGDGSLSMTHEIPFRMDKPVSFEMTLAVPHGRTTVTVRGAMTQGSKYILENLLVKHDPAR